MGEKVSWGGFHGKDGGGVFVNVEGCDRGAYEEWGVVTYLVLLSSENACEIRGHFECFACR